jgi:hypothetical protein
VVQRVPVAQVMLGKHHFFTSTDDNKLGYTVKEGPLGIAGFHVTLFPHNMTEEQDMEARENGKQLSELPNYKTIQFDEFNVTRTSGDTGPNPVAQPWTGDVNQMLVACNGKESPKVLPGGETEGPREDGMARVRLE